MDLEALELGTRASIMRPRLGISSGWDEWTEKVVRCRSPCLGVAGAWFRFTLSLPPVRGWVLDKQRLMTIGSVTLSSHDFLALRIYVIASPSARLCQFQFFRHTFLSSKPTLRRQQAAPLLTHQKTYTSIIRALLPGRTLEDRTTQRACNNTQTRA